MMRAPLGGRAFQKNPDRNLVKTERSKTIYELQKIKKIEAPLNVHNLKTKPPSDECNTPYDRTFEMMRALPNVKAFQKCSNRN